MRHLFVLVMVVIPAAAQPPVVHLVNVGHRASNVFQVGDQFKVLLTGVPNQPVSVRTTMNGLTDWGPVMGTTDRTGRWSAAGQFEEIDFGNWREIWTVGGKLASPAVRFFVNAPCLPHREQNFGFISGTHTTTTCATAEGTRTFTATPSSFRTLDGRSVPGRAAGDEHDVYQMGVLEELITAPQQLTKPVSVQSSRGARGDETAELIANLIGVNALSDGEIRNVVSIVRSAFANPETLAPGTSNPARSLKLLRHLAEFTGDNSVQREIAETLQYLQTR